jgi:hypothetical protein
MNNLDSMSTRRRRKRTFPAALVVLSLAALACRGEAFGIRQLSRRISRTLSDSERFADKNEADTWSKSATRKSSPLQVRKRVKAVLEKARTRTGVKNSSSDMQNTLADAASIGGIADTDFVIGLNSTLDGFPIRNRNGFQSSTAISALPNGSSNGRQESFKKAKDFDAIAGDLPAANAFCEPLPFKLPKLNADQRRLLNEGERIEEQSRMGREGSGFVVLDVHAPPYVVWECLLDFESYPETIPTVREMQLYTSEKLSIGYVNEKPVLPGTGRETRHYGTPSITRAKFVLSKFKLNIAAVHQYTPHPEGDYMEFNLDKSCTNMVLQGAKGIWYTEENPDGKEVSAMSQALSSSYFCGTHTSFFLILH